MTDRYAVMGFPVAHSLSPWLHMRFAEISGDNISYEAIAVAPGQFREAADRFFDAGGRGLNITLPFKFDAWHYASDSSPDRPQQYLCEDMQTPSGESADGLIKYAVFDMHSSGQEHSHDSRAVNVLKRSSDGTVAAASTDGIGLLADLRGWYREQSGDCLSTPERILVVGAGGAAHSSLPALALSGFCETIDIVSRDRSRAENCRSLTGTIAGDHSGSRTAVKKITPLTYSELSENAPYDLIINATSLGHADKAPPLTKALLAAGGCCYDMNYGSAAAPFCRLAAQLGADGGRFSDGFGMLMYQACYSFQLWRGYEFQFAVRDLYRRLRLEYEAVTQKSNAQLIALIVGRGLDAAADDSAKTTQQTRAGLIALALSSAPKGR